MTHPHPWCPDCMGCHVDEEKPQDYFCHPEAQELCFWMKPKLDASELLDGIHDGRDGSSTQTESE